MHTCSGHLIRTLIPPQRHPYTGEEEWKQPCKINPSTGIPYPFEFHPDPLGKGLYGYVFEAYCGDQSHFAIKWITEENERQFEEEIMLQNEAAPYYAKPIYERLECIETHNGESRVKYGYVTDRLDVTLHSDWYTLSLTQIETVREYYEFIFKSIVNLSTGLFRIHPDIIEISNLKIKQYSIAQCEYIIGFIDFLTFMERLWK